MHTAALRPPAPSLPPVVAAALWRADQLGSPPAQIHASGFAALDAVLPGGGWPCQGLTEILSPHGGTVEWRLLGPLLRQIGATGRRLVLVGPPQPPHPPGLRAIGVDERQLVWVQADTPAERLWATEQLLRGRAFGVLVAWLPRARAPEIRRLQVLAAAGDAPVFLCRPAMAAREASAAPLRLRVCPDSGWTLRVELLKRKGPPLTAPLALTAVPGGLSAVLAPRLLESGLPALPERENRHALAGAAAFPDRRPSLSL
jgi:protein ImuA